MPAQAAKLREVIDAQLAYTSLQLRFEGLMKEIEAHALIGAVSTADRHLAATDLAHQMADCSLDIGRKMRAWRVSFGQ